MGQFEKEVRHPSHTPPSDACRYPLWESPVNKPGLVADKGAAPAAKRGETGQRGGKNQ